MRRPWNVLESRLICTVKHRGPDGRQRSRLCSQGAAACTLKDARGNGRASQSLPRARNGFLVPCRTQRVATASIDSTAYTKVGKGHRKLDLNLVPWWLAKICRGHPQEPLQLFRHLFWWRSWVQRLEWERQSPPDIFIFFNEVIA